MRPLRLARVAAEAEAILLRAQARRIALRLALAGVAVVFLLACIGCLHVALWFWLAAPLGAAWAGLVIAAGDAVIALVLIAWAARAGPSRLESEAHAVRDQAWQGLARAYATSALLWPILRSVLRHRRGKG